MEDSRFRTDYALWGGGPPSEQKSRPSSPGPPPASDRAGRRFTRKKMEVGKLLRSLWSLLRRMKRPCMLGRTIPVRFTGSGNYLSVACGWESLHGGFIHGVRFWVRKVSFMSDGGWRGGEDDGVCLRMKRGALWVTREEEEIRVCRRPPPRALRGQVRGSPRRLSLASLASNRS